MVLPRFNKKIVQTTAGQVTLREIKLTDAKDLNKIFNQPAVNPCLNYPPSGIDKTIESIKGEPAKGHKSIIAEIAGHAVGRIVVRPHAGRNSHVTGFGVMFDPNVHGAGVAQTAFEELFEYLKSAGFEIVQDVVHADNARARGFYAKMGFREVGTIANAIKHEDGRYGDEVIIVKNL